MELVRSSIDNVPIAFSDRGRGEPALVFIHGLTGSHTDFDAPMSYFETSHRVVALDLPGSGASGRDRVDWTMATFGRDVVDIVERLELNDVVLVGHSLGGDVTVEAAKLLGERVRALVWVSSHRSLGDIKTDDEIEKWLAPFRTEFVAAMEDLTRRNFGPNADPDQIDGVVASAISTDHNRVNGLLVSYLYNEPALLDGLAAVAAPVFAINPDFKLNNDASFAAYDVGLTVIRDTGHFVMMEQPDRFNKALSAIVSGLPAVS